MADTDIFERVVKVVAETLKADPGSIREDSHFVNDLGAESIQSIELVAAFEDEFDIEMDPDEATAVQTVGGAVGFIANVLKEQQG